MILSVGMFFSNEYWLPNSLREGKVVRSANIPSLDQQNNTSLSKVWELDVKFRNEAANRNWQIPAFNPKTGKIFGIEDKPIVISWKWTKINLSESSWPRVVFGKMAAGHSSK